MRLIKLFIQGLQSSNRMTLPAQKPRRNTWGIGPHLLKVFSFSILQQPRGQVRNQIAVRRVAIEVIAARNWSPLGQRGWERNEHEQRLDSQYPRKVSMDGPLYPREVIPPWGFVLSLEHDRDSNLNTYELKMSEDGNGRKRAF